MGQMVSDLKVIAKHKKKSKSKFRMDPSTSKQYKDNVSDENLNVFKVLPEHFETIYNTNVDQQTPQFESGTPCVRITNPFNSQSKNGMQVILEELSENTDDDEPGPSGITASPLNQNLEFIEDSEEDTTDSDDDDDVPYSYSDAEIQALRRYAEKKGKSEMKPILVKKDQDKRSLLQRKVSFMPSCAIAAARKTKNSWVSKFNCARMKMSKIMTPRRDEFAADEINLFGEGVRCHSNKEWEFMKELIGVESKPTDCSHLPILQEDDFDEEDNNNPFPPVIDLEKFNPDDYPIDDCDEQARKERANEIEEGVNTPPTTRKADEVKPESAVTLQSLCQKTLPKTMYDQVDFIYRLVPNLFQITSCSYYWGKMDRYEAERLLDGKPEGTFLLRDSAQDDYLFSVSFRKYCRSLHARIEQWNHQFSFDSHDPGVFASTTVCGLIEHYKDPSCCMFFEPMLTIPLHRTRTFSLQHLARAAICETITYDSIDLLNLPKSMKAYLHEYHYKQKIRVRSANNEESVADNVDPSQK